MNTAASISITAPPRIGDFLRGDAAAMESWLARFDARQLAFCLAVIVLGAGVFGAAVGIWRSPMQALYTAIKLPLIILLTTLGNALLNGMLAPLLGLNLRFRQSLLAILMSHTVAATILGSLSPIMLFIAWNAPPLDPAAPRGTLGFEFAHLVKSRAGIRVWTVIYLLVALQMTTALRPIIGTADTLLPTEKKFFLAHWSEVMSESAKAKPTLSTE